MRPQLARPPRGDLARAYRRLHAAYEQTRRDADGFRRLYHRTQRFICQSLLGLASALDAKDPSTHGHAERVGRWSRCIADELGLAASEVESIAQAGLLHDIGKIGVPEAVLVKRDPLAPEELAPMRRHPVIGAQIVAPFEFLAGAALIIRYHHERWDGSGYPDGLAGTAIPLGARIVAVADAYDAFTSGRPRRAAVSSEEASARLLEAAGRTLDAQVVTAFLGLSRREVRP